MHLLDDLDSSLQFLFNLSMKIAQKHFWN